MNDRRVLLLPLLAALLLVSGCLGGVLNRPSAEKRFYNLEAERPQAEVPRPGGKVLAVRRLSVSPRYEGRELVYRTGETAFAADFYNLFFVPPAQMLTQDLRQWLGRSGLLATVVDTGSLARADLSLEGNVAALYGDYSGGKGLAVAEMQFLVLDERAPETPILFSRTYRREVPVAPGDPKALVLGLRRAVSAIYGELEEDLRGLPALR